MYMSTDIVGQQAPDISLPASDGTSKSLADFKGRTIVLYFYPKDMTPGCTTEACDFRDDHPEFENLNTVVIGVSPDDLQSHDKFIQKHDLPFLLLADEDKQLTEAFGAWQLKNNFGKEYMGVVRSTFIIDSEGTVVKEWRNVRVKNHVQEVLDAVKQLAS
jgi:thioredoxin-dependent peroxiredoxin